MKQEVYLKEVANKFGISEQSLFNELNVQKQIQTKQFSPQQRPEQQERPKMEVVPADLPKVNTLLILEEKLVELMLKYGDLIVERTDEENKPYQITVIEEIIDHLDEDQYEIQSSLNQNIINGIKEGISEKTLRSGNFFLTLMDADITQKVANVLLDPYELSNWEKHQIFFSKEEDVVPKIVQDVIFRHKREYVMKLMGDLKSKLSESENNDELYKTMMNLTQLKKDIDQKLFRVL